MSNYILAGELHKLIKQFSTYGTLLLKCFDQLYKNMVICMLNTFCSYFELFTGIGIFKKYIFLNIIKHIYNLNVKKRLKYKVSH